MDTKKHKLEEVEVKFRKMKRPGSYISTKVMASPSHQWTPKKLKVVSTHVKRTSPKALYKEKIIYMHIKGDKNCMIGSHDIKLSDVILY